MEDLTQLEVITIAGKLILNLLNCTCEKITVKYSNLFVQIAVLEFLNNLWGLGTD